MRSMIELESSIRNPDVKPHFHEAVLAYQAGAYRAAIIESWVAVALDLAEKIRSLADGGDSVAQAIVHDTDDAIAKRDIEHLQRLERDILINRAKEFGIVSYDEATMLDRLKKDGTLCVPPSWYWL